MVNGNTAQLFDLIQNAGTIEEAIKDFKNSFQISLSNEEFIGLLKKRFSGYGILALDEGEEKKLPEHYVNLRIRLFSPKVAAIFSKPLKIFYNPILFWPILIIVSSFLLFIHSSFSNHLNLQNEDYITTILIVYFSLFIHELGHIASCNYFKIRHGEVGFGFYLYIFPVLYADVTNVWQASRHQRIITNLGGIFSQLLYSSIISILYIFTKYEPLLFASMIITISSLWQLNPFVRHDGYWVLSDLTNTPNLLPKSKKILQRHITWLSLLQVIRSKGKILLNKKIFLLLYGLINLSIIFVFAYYTIKNHGDQLLVLPSLILSLLIKLFNGKFIFSSIYQIPLIAVAFYIMAFRFLISSSLKLKNKLFYNQE